jgi:hypothetical protein
MVKDKRKNFFLLLEFLPFWVFTQMYALNYHQPSLVDVFLAY